MACSMHVWPSMSLGANDLRTRGDPLAWIGFASCAGALATVAALPAAVVAIVAAVLLARTGARWLVLCAGLALAVGTSRAHLAVARHERVRSAVVDAGGWPARCTALGTVSRSPSMIGGGLRLEIDDVSVRCRDGPPLGTSRITLHVPLEESDHGPTFARGDRISAIAALAPPYRFWNDGSSDPRPSSARRGVVLSGGAEDVVVVREGSGVMWTIDRARARIRQRIIASFPRDTAPMARALVLGEDDLPELDQQAFRRSGLAHLLAVSGMHLVLVVMGFVAGLRAILVRVPAVAAGVDAARIAAAVGLPVAWLYAELAGGSGSAVRAAWMCTVALAARVLARRSAPWRALGVSLVAMSLLDPLIAFDLSFVLSALATTGLLALARPIEDVMTTRLRICDRALPGFVVRPLATTAAATIACAPVLATMAPELPLSGLVANVIAVPLGEAAALPLCLVHALLAEWPAAEQGCAAAASGALLLVRMVARAFAWGSLPVPSPTAEQLGAFAGTAVGVSLGKPRSWLCLGAVALVSFEIAARIRGAPHGVLRVTFVDVGQGDAALVDLPDGSTMLIDGGGLVGSPIDVGERAVAPLLAARRRKALAAVVLTHPHPDHHLGLTSALARVTPKAFWDNGQGEVEGTGGAYASLLADMRARNVPVLAPAELCGVRTFGGAAIEVLSPCPGLVPDRGANDNSFVLRIRFGDRAVLFMGDAEREEERELVERFGQQGGLRADVLKVGHHGSRTSSSPALLEAVKPRVAVISCGVRNRFGHPHAATIDALVRAGARIYRTDRDGGVVVTTDGRSLDVRAMVQH
jgi:competence protein ComEC